MKRKTIYLLLSIVIISSLFIFLNNTIFNSSNSNVSSIETSTEPIESNKDSDMNYEEVPIKSASESAIDEAPEQIKDIEIDEEKEPESEPEKPIKIAFGGDILMDTFFADYIEAYGVDYSWTDISDIMNEADLSVVNLETSVSERGSTKKPKGYGFRSAPYTLEGLVNAGIDFVSTANNHILDYGVDAFYDTINNLDEYGIKYAGIGSNIEEAESMTIIEKEGIKIGFINYCSILPWDDWRADDENPGLAPLQEQDVDRVLKNIEANNDECDVLITIVHWGVEYQSRPEEKQIELAHKMIDAGADIIIGHHPHVLQGIELYKEKPIFYSIGNFIFLKMNDNAGRTGIFELEINKTGFLGGKLYPIYIQHCKANLLKEEDPVKQEIINKMIKLSGEFGTEINKDGSF